MAQLKKAAKKIALHTTSNVVVSLDHDFFYPASELKLPSDNVADEQLYRSATDWSMEEWFSKERARSQWDEYASRLEVMGFDPIKLNKPSNDPAPEVVIEYLKSKYNCSDLFIGDSHLWGLVLCMAVYQQTGMPVQLIHLDTHHDCGYINYIDDGEEKSKQRAKETPAADDWVFAGLEHGIIESVQIIYPNWRGYSEWNETNPPTVESYLIDKIDVLTYEDATMEFEWSESEDGKIPQDIIEATFLYVRSSAFVPSWGAADQEFLAYARLLHPEKTCLDCSHNLEIGNHDACQVR
jgi:hypothetical protein